MFYRFYRPFHLFDSRFFVITSNTFRTNPCSLKIFNEKNENRNLNLCRNKLNSTDEVKKAMDILTTLRKEIKANFLIAGSNPPSHDCYTKKQVLSYEETRDNHIQHIRLLHENGADFILNETQSFYNEIELCQKFCFQNNIASVISLYVNDDLTLNSGEYVLDILRKIDELNPLAISFNCINAQTFSKIVDEGSTVLKSLNCGVGFYLNCGNPNSIETNYLENDFNAYISPKEYSAIVKKYEELNPILVGACCMSNPEHIKEIFNLYSQ